MRRLLTLRSSPERTLESLYEWHVRDIYRYALVLLGSPADAEDVTQATFLNAYRAIEGGERPRQPQRWLRAIAHNLCRQHFRQAARRPREVALEHDVEELVVDEQSPSIEELTRALKHLPFNQRSALVMREFEGRSLQDIAQALEISRAAVETLLFRARRSLREQLEEGLSCLEAERAISRQLDGILTRRERGALRAHLRQCDQCAGLARRLRAQRGAMRALAILPIPALPAWSSPWSAGALAGTGTGATAVATAGGSSLLGSVIAKVALCAVAATAVGGIGYETVSHHVLSTSGSGHPVGRDARHDRARGSSPQIAPPATHESTRPSIRASTVPLAASRPGTSPQLRVAASVPRHTVAVRRHGHGNGRSGAALATTATSTGPRSRASSMRAKAGGRSRGSRHAAKTNTRHLGRARRARAGFQASHAPGGRGMARARGRRTAPHRTAPRPNQVPTRPGP